MAIDRISGVSGVSAGSYGTGAGKLQGSISTTLEKAYHELRNAVAQIEGKRTEDSALPEVTREDLEGAVGEINSMLDKVNKRLSFRIHDGSERMMVYVIDNKTNEVIRELPPERFLDVIAKIREFVGILIDIWL